jgi:hypothetical protein
MAGSYEFTTDEIEYAFYQACGTCEYFGKQLTWGNSRAQPGRGNGKRIMVAVQLRSFCVRVELRIAC